MFKIFLLLVSLTSGQMKLGATNETYETKEVCEAAITARVAKIKSDLEETSIRVLGARCATDEDFEKAVHSQSATDIEPK